jgi:hypothetical protein
MLQLPRHPRLPQPCGLGDHPELPPHIVIIHRRPDSFRTTTSPGLLVLFAERAYEKLWS